MHDQPKYKPYRGSELFADGRAMRPFVPGTVARGGLREATPFNTGKSGDEFVTEMPVGQSAGSSALTSTVRVHGSAPPAIARTTASAGAMMRRGSTNLPQKLQLRFTVDGDDKIVQPAAHVAKVVDTTGAGDLFAAGFLFGLTRSRDLAECGRLGSLAAGEIIRHFGARPEVRLADLASEHGL